MFYKIAHELITVPAAELDLEKPVRDTRANHRYKYRELRATTTELKNSTVYKTIPQWNKLPARVAEAESLASFKAQLARPEGHSA